MCGILGHIGGNLNPDAFARALAALHHRGPDHAASRSFSLPAAAVTLGHARLSIIDLSAVAHQPMSTPDGRHTIVYNGELYNYRELRAELEAMGIAFRTRSDTEVLLNALAVWGRDCLPRLDGIFAFAHLDAAAQTLTLARDPLGVKPLYTAETPAGFLFASEITPLLRLGVVPRLRADLLGEYLANLWVFEPDTLFDGIRKLPAAACLTLDLATRRSSTSVYWDVPPPRPPFASEPEALEQLEHAVRRAVESQMVADVPVGAYVSGGVDSSIVAALAAQSTSHPIVTVGARFAPADRPRETIPDDGPFIDRLVQANPHFAHSDLVLSQDLFPEYERILRHVEEPIADPAAVPAFLLARAARDRGAVVMLSGMGGDELFGGYERYLPLPVLPALQRTPAFLLRGGAAAARHGQAIPNHRLRQHARNAERLLRGAADDWPLAYANLAGHFAFDEIDALVDPDWRSPLQARLQHLLAGWEHASLLRQAQRIDLKGFLASHNCVYLDKASMAASVEVRVPLMNPRLTALAFSLPDPLILRPHNTKPLLKELCARVAGPEYAYRPKAGFAMPIRSWLAGPLRETLRDRLHDSRLRAVCRAAALDALLDQHKRAAREHTWKLWTLLTLSLWIDAFDVRV